VPGGTDRLSDAARDVTEPPGCVDVSEFAAFPFNFKIHNWLIESVLIGTNERYTAGQKREENSFPILYRKQ
jgi:hypothetical protein